MDNIELTKIAGAVLAALLLIVGTKTLVESKSSHVLAKPGYTLPGGTPPVADAKAAPAAADKPAADKKAADAAPAAAPAAAAAPAGDGGADTLALLAKASADNGKAAFAKCKSCHAIEKGKNGVGPSLYGVVNRAKGSAEGFGYSDAMKAKGGNWTFEDLAKFMTSPKGFVAGTKMVFTGVPAAADRADLLAYLATVGDAPVPLPK